MILFPQNNYTSTFISISLVINHNDITWWICGEGLNHKLSNKEPIHLINLVIFAKCLK